MELTIFYAIATKFCLAVIKYYKFLLYAEYSTFLAPFRHRIVTLWVK